LALLATLGFYLERCAGIGSSWRIALLGGEPYSLLQSF
jgi:hypothetical protein